MIIDNSWYGHRKILADYCGLPDRPAFATIRHGWCAFLGQGEGIRRLEAAPFLVWRRELQEAATMEGVRNVRAIGAPFLYLVKLMAAERVAAPEGEGTIAFPQHSSEASRATYDVAEFVAAVRAESPGPFTVSLGHFEYQRDSAIVAQYQDAGFRVVSFGPRANQRFLHQLHREVQAHSTVVTNYAGTPLFYGLALGKRGRVIGTRPSLTSCDERDVHTREVVASRYPRLFRDGVCGAEALDIAALELGRDSMMSPDELAATLGWTDRLRCLSAALISRYVAFKYGQRAVAGDDEKSIQGGGRFR